MKLVNRSVRVLKPTAKMLDWINAVGEESDSVTMEEAQGMTNAYLLPEFEDDRVFYFGKKQLNSCAQVVTTRIHVHSWSFITDQNH